MLNYQARRVKLPEIPTWSLALLLAVVLGAPWRGGEHPADLLWLWLSSSQIRALYITGLEVSRPIINGYH